jgi:hypothetical protein
MKCSVVIPIYKNYPTEFEKKSYIQCLKILHKHPIIIACPENFDGTYYFIIAKEQNIDFKLERFRDICFSNIAEYNKLMLSRDFYKRFKKFDYILLYQLDAWVFCDEIDYWCNQGYDFIGAPWVNLNIFNWLQTGFYPRKLYYLHKILLKGQYLSKVGNGGFSLRKVKSFLLNIGLFNKTASNWRENEDVFFSHYVKTFNPFFRIAPVRKALKFSFDTFPGPAFVMNNQKLPFGCHAWYREDTPYEQNYTFWKDIVKI